MKEASRLYEQTIVMITHSQSIAQTADRILRVSDGVVTDFGKVPGMRSYLSLIPISAKVHRRQNRMTLLCIIFAVFMVTAIFSMAEMGARMEQSRLADKHGDFSLLDSLMDTTMGQTLMVTAVGMFFAGSDCRCVLMISSSMNSSVTQRTQFFGMMRCIGMSKQQIIRFVRLEALNWCKTAVPIGLVFGILASWVLCAALRFLVGEEFSNIPLFGISGIGIGQRELWWV